MKLPGMKMDSPLMNFSGEFDDNRVEQFENVDAEAIIRIRNAYLDFHSKYHVKYPGRPFMVFLGECIEVQGDLPFGVTKMPFYNDNVVKSDVIYEFSDDELSQMAGQGLFNTGFKVPEEFIGAEINIPVKCSLTVIKPELEDGIPLMFVSINDNRHIVTDSKHSDWAFGYEFDTLELSDEFEMEDDFIDDKDFDKTFGIADELKVETKEEPKKLIDRNFEMEVDDIYNKVKEREEALNESSKSESFEASDEWLDNLDLEMDEFEDDSEFFSSEDFEDVFDEEELSELTDSRNEEAIEKADTAKDLTEAKEEETIRRLADESGISKEEVERELGD